MGYIAFVFASIDFCFVERFISSSVLNAEEFDYEWTYTSTSQFANEIFKNRDFEVDMRHGCPAFLKRFGNMKYVSINDHKFQTESISNTKY